LRGAESNHTLVLIDGIEMNDPSSPGGAFDFADLQVDNIERIEILRGAQSAVYGSDAIGGVINIITKKGQGKPKFQASGEGGSYDTFKVRGGVSGGTERVNYSLNASRLETSGFSAADRLLGNRERDGYKNSTVSARAGVQALDNLDFGWTMRFNEGKAEIDNCGGRGCDDPNNKNLAKELFTRGFGHLKLFDGLWEQTLGMAYSRTDRRNVNNFDPLNPFASKSNDLGEKIKVDWQNILHLHEANTLTLGIEDEEDSLSSGSTSGSADSSSATQIGQKTMNTAGYYLEDQVRLFNRSFTTAGVRYDNNNRVGGRVTWRATQVFAIDEIGMRIKGSYGTGFKAPSLYQLFAPPFFDPFSCPPPSSICQTGNPNLKPESSRSWDAGLEQSFWGDKFQLGASYFNNRFTDLIVFELGHGYKNIASATAEGVESFVEFKPMEDLTLRGNYTYTRTNDASTDERLFRRPTHKGSFDVRYRFLEKADVGLNILLVGDRDFETFSTPPRKTLSGYVLVNLAAGYEVNKHLKLFARVDNLFDKKYEEVLGYGTSGIAGYGGVTLSYD
jgi:vitamin B12 transporter